MRRSTLIVTFLFVFTLAGYPQTNGTSQEVVQANLLSTTSTGFVGRLGEHNRTLTVLPPPGASVEFAFTWQHNEGSLPPGAIAEGQVLTFDSLTFEHAGEYTCTAVDLADPEHTMTSPSMTVSVVEELPVADRMPVVVLTILFLLVVLSARYFRREDT